MASALEHLPLEREYRLGDGDIVDFFGEGIAVEVKLKGSRRAIFNQLERYAGHESVASVLLVTNVPTGMPSQIKGKPVRVFNIGLAWL